MLTTNAVERGNAEAAVDVMKFLGSYEVQKLLTLANMTIPTNKLTIVDPDVQAIYEVARFADALSLGTPMGNHKYIQCQWAPVADATYAIWHGLMTPVEAMNTAQLVIEGCVAGIGP